MKLTFILFTPDGEVLPNQVFTQPNLYPAGTYRYDIRYSRWHVVRTIQGVSQVFNIWAGCYDETVVPKEYRAMLLLIL